MQVARWVVASTALTALVFGAAPASAYKVDRDSGTVTLTSLADFDKCAREVYDGDACLEGLKAYVAKQPKDAFGAGKRARLQYQHWTAISFFAKAFSKAATPEQCQDEDVGMALVSALSLPSDDPNVALARKVAEQCWAQTQPKLTAELKDAASYYKANMCPVFAEKKVSAPECAPAKPEPAKPTAPTVADLLKGVDWKQLATDPNSARVYRSRHGEEVSMIRTKPGAREYVLLKFKNVSGPWNGQVIVTVEQPGGIGKNYVTIADQREWVAVTERQGYYEAYPKGVKETIALYEVALDRGLKERPTTADVSGDFKPAAAAAPPKR
ncbi:MAG TPA: hypothetical protein VJV78_00455 [Polyangiales bacterium]|nr:hypothetical protein [Polyangiales bacterium]